MRLYDEKGLYLEIVKSGSKLWRLKYRFNGKEKRLALGAYPEVPLAGRKSKVSGEWIAGARDKRDEARRQLSEGIDPAAEKRARKLGAELRAANSFEAVAREWYEKQNQTWVASHGERIISRLERDIFPWIGSRPIAELVPPELLSVIRRIEQRGALETAHRALSNCGQIFRYAIATGRAERDMAADLRGALPPVKQKHFPAVTEPSAVGPLLRALDGYSGTPMVKAALRLAPLVFVRPGELRSALWADIDLSNAEWRFTVTKTDTRHIVPLATQSIAILQDLRPVTARSEYVFPSARSAKRPMSDNAVLAALRRLGIAKDEMSGHGFRAMARTILDEVLGCRPDYIEHQLAHAVRDPNGRAYNRTAYLPERREMMQRWADYLDELRLESSESTKAGGIRG